MTFPSIRSPLTDSYQQYQYQYHNGNHIRR
jgi:hypothetical protein